MSTAIRTIEATAREVRGWVFNIQRFCGDDGPGIRTSVFLKGCPLRCLWCHNPESQLLKPQFSYDRERCLSCDACFAACPEQAISPEMPFPPAIACTLCESCVDACPTGARQLVGRSLSVDDVLAECQRDRDFYEESEGGVTFSGGEPLTQPTFLKACLEACREHNLETAVDTCGYAKWDDLQEVAELTDLILYDLKAIDDSVHEVATGVSNRRILRNLYRLAAGDTPMWIRIPLVPGINDNEKSLQAFGCTLGELPRRLPVYLLPYHELGCHKRSLMGFDEAPLFPVPSKERVAEYADQLRSYGLEVIVKGNP